MDRDTRTELAADRAAAGTGPYTLTVYAAAPGTPIRDDTGQVHTSVAGHVYYSISDGRRSNGYGFSPIEGGRISGPGQVVRDEHLAYQAPLYARTLEISADQYARLRDYGESAIARTTRAFDLQYHGASNSCIDFTWTALEQAGLRRELQILPGVRIDLPPGHEGQLKVLDNIRDFERLAPPVPGSPLNREQRHPMPDRTLWQRLLSENEAGPAAPPRATSTPDDPRHAQIRDAVHRLDAARGRTPDDASERLIAGLFTEVARNPAMRRVDDVVLSAATAEHAAGRMAFAVHRPFGEREPVFHAGVDVQAALAQPVEAHARQAAQVREQQSVREHAQAASHEQGAQRPPVHVMHG